MKLLIVALVFTFAVAASALHEVSSESDLDAQIQAAGSKLVVVDFFATWCGPCQEIAPRLVRLAKKYADKVVIVKVDVDKLYDLSEKYEVTSMPTFVFLKNGRKVQSFVGADRDRIEETIRNFS